MENMMKEKINNFLNYQKQLQDAFTNFMNDVAIIEKEKDYVDRLLDSSTPIFGLKNAFVIKKELCDLKFDKSNYINSITANSDVFKKVNKFQFPIVNSINQSIDETIKERFAIEEESYIEEIDSLRNTWRTTANKLEQNYNQSMIQVNNSLNAIAQVEVEECRKRNAGAKSKIFGVLTFISLLIGAICLISLRFYGDTETPPMSLFFMGIGGIVLFLIGLIITFSFVVASKGSVASHTIFLQNIENVLASLKKSYLDSFTSQYNAYNDLLREKFRPTLEEMKNEIFKKNKKITEEKEKRLNILSKEYYAKPHLTVDQQQLYCSLELPERAEFVKLGVLTSTDEGLIDVYQKCLDLAIKRKTLAEQHEQTRILDETKRNAEEHQKVVEQQNEEARLIQEAQLFVEQEAAREAERQSYLIKQQNSLVEKQNKELKKQTKIAKKTNKEMKEQTGILRRNIGN